jgi:hypothetical protein
MVIAKGVTEPSLLSACNYILLLSFMLLYELVVCQGSALFGECDISVASLRCDSSMNSVVPVVVEGGHRCPTNVLPPPPAA